MSGFSIDLSEISHKPWRLICKVINEVSNRAGINRAGEDNFERTKAMTMANLKIALF